MTRTRWIATWAAAAGWLVLLLPGCGVARQLTGAPPPGQTLTQARRGFVTALREPATGEPLADVPGVFHRVRYRSGVGELEAYLTPDPGTGRKHPAIVWITGGDSSTIDASLAEPASPDNDQTARAYRDAGVVTMFPTLRGGNANPGEKEGFLGEVDDVLAAAEYLASVPYVDPGRIYLGGHSTGGTLALLVAETSDRFRAVFAFGPAADVRDYGGSFLPPGRPSRRDYQLRSPIHWLETIRSPVFVIEGTVEGNIASVRGLRRASKNPNLRCIEVEGADHFSVLAPVNALLARRILADPGPPNPFILEEAEIAGAAR